MRRERGISARDLQRTVRARGATMSLSTGSGGQSNTRKSTYVPTEASRRLVAVLAAICNRCRPHSSLRRANVLSGLCQPAKAGPYGGITKPVIHLFAAAASYAALSDDNAPVVVDANGMKPASRPLSGCSERVFLQSASNRLGGEAHTVVRALFRAESALLSDVRYERSKQVQIRSGYVAGCYGKPFHFILLAKLQ